jgi:hypothetical protein
MPGLKAAVRGALDSAFPGPDAVALLPGFVGARGGGGGPAPASSAPVAGLLQQPGHRSFWLGSAV